MSAPTTLAGAKPAIPTWLQLANLLTLSRLVLAIILFGLMALELWIPCILVFALAALTDWLDGKVARMQGLVSSFGRVMDPLADKVLICGAFVFLLPLGSSQGWLMPWMVTMVICRELIISGLRDQLESLGASFGADWLGKLKMGLQSAALVAIFTALECHSGIIAHRMQPEWLVWIDRVRDLLVWAMVIATVVSGANYLVRIFLPRKS